MNDKKPDDKAIEDLAKGIDQGLRRAVYAAGLIVRELAGADFSDRVKAGLVQSQPALWQMVWTDSAILITASRRNYTIAALLIPEGK